MPDRQQFNVSLPPDLVRRVKHRAVDDQLSLSDLVERVLKDHLAAPLPVVLSPMVHVERMGEAVDVFAALGARVLEGSRDGDWARLALGDAEIGLLAHPPNPEQGEGTVELNLTARDLDALAERLDGAGVGIVRPVTDEGFGRQLQVRGPDGLLIKVNELDPSLYT